MTQGLLPVLATGPVEGSFSVNVDATSVPSPSRMFTCLSLCQEGGAGGTCAVLGVLGFVELYSLSHHWVSLGCRRSKGARFPSQAIEKG